MQSQQIEAASNITLAEVKANEAEEAEFDFSKVEAIDLDKVLKANFDKGKFLTLGQIAIPSVKLNLPIYKGLAKRSVIIRCWNDETYSKDG